MTGSKNTSVSPNPKPNKRLETKAYEADPRSLSLLKEGRNARYMTAEQMKRLTENVKRDGVLTSAVLVFRPRPENVRFYTADDDRPVVLSGNHRAQVAIAAALETIPLIEILTPITDEEATAIQLSHNAITGQDDPSLLLDLYESLDLNEKLYSGLTDDQFKIEELDLSGMSIGNPTYQELTLLFLPAEAADFIDLVKRIEKRSKRPLTLAAVYDDFDRVFDTIVKVKEGLNVYNTALAFRMMAELALERLEQIDQEQAQKPAA